MARRRLGLVVAVFLLSFLVESTSFRRFQTHRRRDSTGYDSDDGDSIGNEQGGRFTPPWRHPLEPRLHHGMPDHNSGAPSKGRQRRHLTDEDANRPFRHRHPTAEDVDEFSVRHSRTLHPFSPGKYRETEDSDSPAEFLRSPGADRPLHNRWSREFPKLHLSDDENRLHSAAGEEQRTNANLKSIENDALARPHRAAYSGPPAAARNPSVGISSQLRVHPPMNGVVFGAEGERKKSMLLAARDLEPENERLDESSSEWLDLVRQDDTKRGKRTSTFWKERRDREDLSNSMPDRFLDSVSLKSAKDSFSHGDLMKGEFDEPHSKYMEHFARAKPGSIGGRRDFSNEGHRRDSHRLGEPIRFVAGSFHTEQDTREHDSSQLFKERSKQTATADIKSDNGKAKTIMNVNLLMDQSGGLKIEMNTPKKEKRNKEHSDGPGAVTNVKQVLVKGTENASPHSVFMEHQRHLGTSNERSHNGQTKNQGSLGSRKSGLMEEHLNGASGTPHFRSVSENAAQFQGTPQTSSHGSLESHQSLMKSLLDVHTERENSKNKDEPKLLFGQLDIPRQVVSDAKQSDLAPAGYSDEKTTVIDFAPIPSLVNVDNPLISGCTVQKCFIACPGQLWKLSTVTGCPTCECCPSVNCKVPCKHGYEADMSGCPTCKCLTEH